MTSFRAMPASSSGRTAAGSALIARGAREEIFAAWSTMSMACSASGFITSAAYRS